MELLVKKKLLVLFASKQKESLFYWLPSEIVKYIVSMVRYSLDEKIPFYFTEMIPSTISVLGLLSNIQHNEEELTPELIYYFRDYSGPMKAIDSNYGHAKFPGYEKYEKPKKSTRGRKKAVKKKKKKRKKSGDGTCFNSQITFSIENTWEGETRLYFIKLFRNGKIQIPGVRNIEMRDVMNPINVLVDLLVQYFCGDIKLVFLKSTMRNRKYQLKPNGDRPRCVDRWTLFSYYQAILDSKLKVSIDDIEDYLRSLNKNKYSEIDFRYKLENSESRFKPLNINIDHLFHLMIKYNVPEIGVRIKKMVQTIRSFHNIMITTKMVDDIFNRVIDFVLPSIIEELNTSPNNNLHSVAFRPKKYQGLLVKFKTPIEDDEKKVTTVKIFKSKINIDGARDDHTIERLYRYVNHDCIDRCSGAIYHDDELSDEDVNLSDLSDYDFSD